MPPSFVAVARSQLVIRFLARERVKDTDHDGVGNRHDRALLPPTRRQRPYKANKAVAQGEARGEPDAVTDDFTGKAVSLVTLSGGWRGPIWLPILVFH